VPLPKQRHSKARGRKRRTNWKLKAAGTAVCPQCKQPKLPHRICKVCGFYKGRQVIEIKEKTKKGKKE